MSNVEIAKGYIPGSIGRVAELPNPSESFLCPFHNLFF